MSRSSVTTRLWQDPQFRQTQTESRRTSREVERNSWPRVNCLQCNVEFVVQPCRLGVKKFCNRECQTAYRTGRPNLKNRGRIPSGRVGSGISGKYKGQLFRSLYELSFIINVLEANAIEAAYEELRIPLEGGKHYVPDFVSHKTKTIYEIKYTSALSQPNVALKLDAGRRYAETIGYRFEVFTEEHMRVFTLDEIVEMVRTGIVVLHAKRNGGIVYQRMMRKLGRS